MPLLLLVTFATDSPGITPAKTTFKSPSTNANLNMHRAASPTRSMLLAHHTRSPPHTTRKLHQYEQLMDTGWCQDGFEDGSVNGRKREHAVYTTIAKTVTLPV